MARYLRDAAELMKRGDGGHRANVYMRWHKFTKSTLISDGGNYKIVKIAPGSWAVRYRDDLIVDDVRTQRDAKEIAKTIEAGCRMEVSHAGIICNV